MWVDRSGKNHVKAAFGGRDGKFVRLVKDNDSVVDVPLDRLSSNDMAYVLQRSSSQIAFRVLLVIKSQADIRSQFFLPVRNRMNDEDVRDYPGLPGVHRRVGFSNHGWSSRVDWGRSDLRHTSSHGQWRPRLRGVRCHELVRRHGQARSRRQV